MVIYNKNKIQEIQCTQIHNFLKNQIIFQINLKIRVILILIIIILKIVSINNLFLTEIKIYFNQISNRKIKPLQKVSKKH